MIYRIGSEWNLIKLQQWDWGYMWTGSGYTVFVQLSSTNVNKHNKLTIKLDENSYEIAINRRAEVRFTCYWKLERNGKDIESIKIDMKKNVSHYAAYIIERAIATPFRPLRSNSATIECLPNFSIFKISTTNNTKLAPRMTEEGQKGRKASTWPLFKLESRIQWAVHVGLDGRRRSKSNKKCRRFNSLDYIVTLYVKST